MTVSTSTSKESLELPTTTIQPQQARSPQVPALKSSIETAARRALTQESVTNVVVTPLENLSITASSSPRSATPLSPKASSMKGAPEHPSRATHILKCASPRASSPLSSSPRTSKDGATKEGARLSRRTIDSQSLEPMKRNIRMQIESHYSGEQLSPDRKAGRAGLYVLLARASHNELQELQAITIKALLDIQEAFSELCAQEHKSSPIHTMQLQQIHKSTIDLQSLIQDYTESLGHNAPQVDDLLNRCKEKAKALQIDLGEQKVHFKLGIS